MRAVSRGFSLIEMMAVVFLISIAFSMSVFLFSDNDPERQLSKALERFTLLSQHASEMSGVNSEAYGLILIPPAWRDDPLTQGWLYRWQRLGRNGWEDVEEFGQEEFAPGVELSISIEGQEWEYDDDKDEMPNPLVPIIGFFPGGDITPFEIEVGHQDFDMDPQHIEVSIWGEIVWRERQEAEEEAEEMMEFN